MDLFGFDSIAQNGLDFPAPLTEKYRPRKIEDFAGLDSPKRILTKFAANPRKFAFTFIGPSGTGKTSMGMALADAIGAEIHHVPSQECTLARLQSLCYSCNYVPMAGRQFHLNLVDEADVMSDAAQKFLLSKLDATGMIDKTIWVFTCNSKDRLEDRFLSRTMEIPFSSYGISAQTTELLTRVWQTEVGSAVPAPNFSRLVKDANNNVRESLMSLERAILAA